MTNGKVASEAMCKARNEQTNKRIDEMAEDNLLIHKKLDQLIGDVSFIRGRLNGLLGDVNASGK